jgi:hypothetical protein
VHPGKQRVEAAVGHLVPLLQVGLPCNNQPKNVF